MLYYHTEFGVNYDTASVAPMTGVSVFGTTEGVSYLHKHLTPLFGVTMTPSFLQCACSIIVVPGVVSRLS